MKVIVSKKNIEAGEPRNHEACPIALALQPLVGDCHLNVGRLFATIDGRRYDLPLEAMNFVGRFDNGSAVEPFEFELVGL